MAKNDSALFWYETIGDNFFNDFDIKMLLKQFRKLDGPVEGMYIYIRLILIVAKYAASSNAGDMYLVHTRSNMSLAEELSVEINDEPEYIQATLDCLKSAGLLEEQEDGEIYLLHFPEGTIKSITGSGIRKRGYRSKIEQAKKQTGDNVSSMSPQSPQYNNYSNNQNNNYIKNDINIDSNSNINIDNHILDIDSLDNESAADVSARAATPERGGAPDCRPLFSFDEVKAQADRRKADNRISDDELSRMYQEFCSNNFMLYRTYRDKDETETQALYHAVNTWAKNSSKKKSLEWSPDYEPEDIKRFTDPELKRLFPSIAEKDPEGFKVMKEVLEDAWTNWKDHGAVDYEVNSYAEDGWIEEIQAEAWQEADAILKKADKYFPAKVYEDENIGIDGYLASKGIGEEYCYETFLPYFMPKNQLNLTQRRLLYTFHNVQFPADKNYKLLKVDEVIKQMEEEKQEDKKTMKR